MSNECCIGRGGKSASLDWLSVEVSEMASGRAKYCFTNFVEWLGKDILLNRIDTKLLAAFQLERFKSVSSSTLTREMHAIMRLLKHNGIMIEKPTPPKRLKRTEQRDLSEDEIRRFFAACEDEDHKTPFALLLATGARTAEVVPSVRSGHTALLKTELDHEKCSVTIRCAKIKPGQRQRSRSMRIQRELMTRLVELAGRTEGQFVFMPNQSLSKLFDRLCSKSAIPKVDALGRKATCHSLRHSFATVASQAVQSTFELKELLGHQKMVSTEGYVHAKTGAVVIDISDLTGVGVM